MRKILFLSIIYCTMLSVPAWGGNESKRITVETQNKRPPTNYRPHGPEKPMVEAWLDDTVLTIEFIEPQGEATLSLSNADVELESVTFSSEVPFVIDLTPYPDAETFTIETEFS